MVSELSWLSGHKFKSHHHNLFDKNQAQINMSMRNFQAQRAFTWGDLLESNINHILEPHLII